jgi:hypothetical protein
MSSINQQLFSAASGRTVTNPTFIPYQTSTEMEALQLQAGALRALKFEFQDEQSEAHYRQSVYAIYDEGLSAITNTNDTTFHACIAINTDVTRLDYGMTHYTHMLQEMDIDLARRPLAASLRGLFYVTQEFEDIINQSFACFKLARVWLQEDHEEVRTAYNELYAVIDSSSWDNILNMDEAMRLLRHLEKREGEVRTAAEKLDAQIEAVWDVLVGQCDLAVRFLRTSGLSGEAGLDALCDWLEDLGEDAGKMEVLIERAEDGYEGEEEWEMEEDRGQDNIILEG